MSLWLPVTSLLLPLAFIRFSAKLLKSDGSDIFLPFPPVVTSRGGFYQPPSVLCLQDSKDVTLAKGGKGVLLVRTARRSPALICWGLQNHSVFWDSPWPNFNLLSKVQACQVVFIFNSGTDGWIFKASERDTNWEIFFVCLTFNRFYLLEIQFCLSFAGNVHFLRPFHSLGREKAACEEKFIHSLHGHSLMNTLPWWRDLPPSFSFERIHSDVIVLQSFLVSSETLRRVFPVDSNKDSIK